MRPFIHRYILPPALLALHLGLLLPLFIAPRIDHRGDGDDDGGDEDSLLCRLKPTYSVVLGLLGFLGVQGLRQVAGKIPLPRDPRRTRLAARIEKTVLFVSGMMEEVWRWGVVRVLIRLLGGEGGFRGRGELWDLTAGVGVANTKYPSIWEAVYLMGWSWSLLESSLSWYTVRPTSAEEIYRNSCTGVHERPSSRRSAIVDRDQHKNPIRRPLLGKRNRSDYSTIFNSDCDTDVPRRPAASRDFIDSIKYKRREAGSRGVSGDLGTVHGAPAQGSGSTTVGDDVNAVGSITPKAYTRTSEMEDEATPRPRVQIQIQIVHPHDMLSENDYGDDEGSFSDSSSVLTSSQASYGSDNGFLTQTPLLSSSLPYDPDQDHPHHEHLPHRQASFSTLGEPPAILGSSILGDSDRDVVRADDSNADDDYDDDRADIVTVHEDDDDRAEEAVNSEPITNNDWHQELSSSIRSPRRRIYPTWPPYSSSYHQNHFPHAFPTAPEPSISGSTIRHHHSRRRVYGIPVDRLPVYLPFMWRAAAALKHVGHALLFAWAPALVFDGRFQWWCFLVLLVLALRKGWNTVEWFGGTASRAGMLKSSTLLLVISAVIYIVGLEVWGILW